jgi:hypothetical protein
VPSLKDAPARLAALEAVFASERLAGTRRRLARLEPVVYAVWAAVWTLASARRFYGYMMKQTGGEWSAPLDDVFIHFDYARSTARGHPFEWVVGNGYSSGNTSIAYPFVLAAGYLAGFRRERIMLWAAIVAATSVFAALLAGRKLFTGLANASGAWDRAASYLLPPMFLSLGALDWTLWSGMEVAFLLATWAIALVAYLALVEGAPGEVAATRGRAWVLGACGALMILTRPEAISTVGAFALGALWARRKTQPFAGAIGLAARIVAPGTGVTAALAALNRVFTGEWSANGAIVKLAVYNPFMSAEAKWNDYAFNFKYEIFRNIEYHFTDAPALGCILPALGLAAVAIPKTRPAALLLWGQIIGWAALVAFNGQVRWQNERYTMPAVAWLTVVAALGASALVRRLGRPNALGAMILGAVAVEAVIASRLPEARPSVALGWGLALAGGALATGALWLWPTRLVCAVAALGLFQSHQLTKMRDQKWFFGRACRNIRDQHIETGRWLREVHPRRVLVGDAGALMYASERPGLDIIGLGGYHDLPFARAGVQGLTATIELMERLEPEELPDVLAIYPSWWGILPTWFGRGVIARTPAVGNVICGGYEDVVYVADWHLLGTGEMPRLVPRGLTIRDTVDVADLVSERAHRYRFTSPGSGYTDLKILPDPLVPTRDVMDGGREVKPGMTESMRFSGLTPGQDVTLLLRAAPVEASTVHVTVNGQPLPPLVVHHEDRWIEPALVVPGHLVGRSIDVVIANDGPGDFVDYHAWAAQ